MRRLSILLLLLPLAACAPMFRRGGTEATPPASFVRSTAELRATRMIEVREGLPKPDAMKLVADALGERYVVEVADPNAGFTMTAWRATMSREGVPDLRYRTRLIARFLGDDTSDSCGVSVAFGDLDADGLDEIIVGCTLGDDGASADLGAVYFFAGG